MRIEFGKDLFFDKSIVEGLIFQIEGVAVIANSCIPRNGDVEILEHFPVEIAVEKNCVLVGVGSEKRRQVSFVGLTMGAEDELGLFFVELKKEFFQVERPIFAFEEGVEWEGFKFEFEVGNGLDRDLGIIFFCELFISLFGNDERHIHEIGKRRDVI